MKETIDLHHQPIQTLILKLSVPMMLSGIVTTSYGFVDMIFASRLGIVEVASIAFVTPLFMMLQALTMGVINAGVSIIATLLGEQQRQQASAYASQLRWITIALSILFVIPTFLLLPTLLTNSGVSNELLTQSMLYANILFVSVPITLMFQLYQSFFKSQGKMKLISMLSILGVIGNVLLNALFIYGLDFAIDGLAYATLITVLIQWMVILRLFNKGQHDVQLNWRFTASTETWRIWKKLLRVGFPLSLSFASTHFGFMILNLFIMQYSHHAVAAFAIGNRIHSLLFTPGKEIGSALIPLIAQNWGRGAVSRVKQAIKLGLWFSVAFGVFAAVMIQLIKYPIADFLSEGDVITYQHVINYVGLVGWTAIAWTIFHTFQGIFVSLQKTLFALVINIVRLWVLRIPGIMLFYYFAPGIAEYGIWHTMFISNAVTLLFAIVYFMLIVPPMLKQPASRPTCTLTSTDDKLA